MEMELVSGSHIPDGLLAAMTLLSEKPRQGVPSWNPAPIQGITEANCTVAIGLRFRCWEIVSGTVDAPSNPANCPALPNHPDWASPSTDIASLQGGWNNIDAIQILNFKRMVQTGGPMDYKQFGDYVDFGNFNFGYVGAGLGMPDEMLRWGAGYANWHDNPQNRPIYGSPFDPNNHTHGDQPGDQAQINAGIAAYKAGCHY